MATYPSPSFGCSRTVTVRFVESFREESSMSSSSAINSSLPNRWILAIAAFCMQLALGSVYAWSVFLKPVASLYYHVPSTQLAAAQLKPTNITFSVVLLALGVTAGFGGYLNNRFGPRVIATAGGILYGSGVILSAFTGHNLFILYLTYGIIGAGAALTAPIAATFLLPTFKLDNTFLILGIAYLVIVVVAAQFFRTAPEG